MVNKDILDNNKVLKRQPGILSAFKALFSSEETEITSIEEKEVEKLISESQVNVKALENKFLSSKNKNSDKKELNKNLNVQNNGDLDKILNDMNEEINVAKKGKKNKHDLER